MRLHPCTPGSFLYLIVFTLAMLCVASCLKPDIAGLKGELRNEMKADIQAEVKTVVDTRMSGLNTEVESMVKGKIGQQNIGMFSGGAGMMLILCTIIFVLLAVVAIACVALKKGRTKTQKKEKLLRVFASGVSHASEAPVVESIMKNAKDAGVAGEATKYLEQGTDGRDRT
jgi:hypothetical protein